MTATTGALAGITVVDLTRVLAGPFGMQMLADHGADVIKVEPPSGDETRDWGPPFKDGDAAYFLGVNRNKRSIGLALDQPAGQAVLKRLLNNADVVVENFKIGTMERWGLGYDAVLKAEFPRLIHCRITGFGANGPFGGRPGYDAVVQAQTGLISINGSPESGPVRLGIPLVDMGTGFNAVIGILMALIERQRSGLGQSIEVALYDTGVQLLHPQGPNFHLSGKAPSLSGNAHPNISPYDLYPTLTRPVFLGVGNDRQFRTCCKILGKPELADDPRFASNGDRVTNRPALTAELQALLKDHDGEAIADALSAAGVPAGAMNSVPEVMTHGQTAARDMVLRQDGYAGPGIPIKLGRTPGRLRRVPPKFGVDGRDVLTAAGFATSEVDRLIADGIVLEERKKG